MPIRSGSFACSCFSSPIRRASRFAELTWGGRQAPLITLPTLKEAHLGWLQGMSQGTYNPTLSQSLCLISVLQYHNICWLQ